MELFVIDELNHEDCKKIKARLKEMELQANIEGIYWLPIPAKLLSEKQKTHSDCSPHVLALELDEDSLKLELLIRSSQKLRCDCIEKPSPELREHMIVYLENLLKDLNIDF
ncbi:hypothetical protein [Desulfovibrio litoralis]|uniref:Uncharacterized protein n=1 Tax=Desulfovibrio litoralis DSM 11393 TaxID=1121455 RepID=A0A1M7SXC3_9BACT|nr:hypothetical protein [Desulfovibrio litoralis]SHN63122.1 hypothetical protein SAMN02745728_01343 [Desulfovibrio litoralis DSM 11393]